MLDVRSVADVTAASVDSNPEVSREAGWWRQRDVIAELLSKWAHAVMVTGRRRWATTNDDYDGPDYDYQLTTRHDWSCDRPIGWTPVSGSLVLYPASPLSLVIWTAKIPAAATAKLSIGDARRRPTGLRDVNEARCRRDGAEAWAVGPRAEAETEAWAGTGTDEASPDDHISPA